MSHSPAGEPFRKGKENTVNCIRKVEQSVSGMSTLNRKILTRNSSICLDDREFDQIHCAGNAGQEENTQRDYDHKEHVNNFPDIVNYISMTSQAHDCLGDCNDPDVVRSNSSSDEKSFDTQASSDKSVCPPKFSNILPTSVSSFSSSGSSKESTSSNLDAERKPKTSPVNSFSSVDNDDQQNEVFCTKASGSTNCIFNQDSVFAQESEDVFDQPQPCRKLQRTTVLTHTSSPIKESCSSPISREEDVTNIVLSSERVQKARSRYSSSGYGTGSGGSAKGNSASKTSVHLSQESFSEGNAVRSQGTQTSTPNNEEPSCAVNGFIPNNFEPYLANLEHTGVQSQTKQRSSESPLGNQSVCNLNSANTQLVSTGTTTKYDLTHVPQKVTCGLTAPIEPQTSGHIRPPAVHGQYASAITSMLQFKKPSEKAHHINVGDAAVQGQLHTTTGSTSQQQPLVLHGKSNTAYTDSPQHLSTPSLHTDSPHHLATPSLHTDSPHHLITPSLHTDSPHHLSTPSLQHYPTSSGSLNYNQFQTTSSSSGSCFVPSIVELRWLAEPSHVSLAKLLLQSGPGASEISGESRYHLESLMRNANHVLGTPAGVSQEEITSDGQNIPRLEDLLSDSLDLSDISSLMMSSREGEFGKRLMEKLQRSARCHEPECDIADCLQIKNALSVLQNPRNHMDFLSEADKLLLMTMFIHTVDVCDHPKCPFTWCGEIIDNSKDQLSQQERLLVMKQRLENFAEHFLFPDSPRSYMKLNSALSYDSIPVEGRDWFRLCMMGNTRRALLVQPVKSEICGLSSDSQYWVIKKVSTTDDGDHWGVYSRLRDVTHKSVATLLWAASFDDHLLVCSLFEGFTLHECLPQFPPQQFRFVPVFNVMQQLTSALGHLNSLDIAYLYWTSKNILVTYKTNEDFVVKLSNFSCSVLLEPLERKQPSYDGGHLLLALPRHIITPELRDNVRVEHASDVWGLGCLLHELVTGYPIWHEHRHALDNDFKLLTMGKPLVPDIYPELVDVFTACWEIDSSKRIQLIDLEIMLIRAFQVHMRS